MIYNITEIKDEIGKYSVSSIENNQIRQQIIDFKDYFYIEKNNDVLSILKQGKTNGIIDSFSSIKYQNKDFYKVYLTSFLNGKLKTNDTNLLQHQRDVKTFVYNLAKRNYKMYEHDVYPEVVKVIYENNIQFLKEKATIRDLPYVVFDIETEAQDKVFPNPSRNFVFYIGATGVNIKGEPVKFYKSVADYTDKQEEYGTIGEREMLKDFLKFLNDNKFVVISGYNIYNFDIWFIAERMKLYNIPFVVNGDLIYQEINPDRADGTFRHSLIKFQNPQYRKFVSQNGSILFFDIFYYLFRQPIERGEIKYKYGSVSLKNVCDFFGVLKKKDRVIIEGTEIYHEFLKNPKYMTQYLVDDVESTHMLYVKFMPIMLFLSYYVNQELSTLFDASSTQILERGLFKEMKEKGLLIFPKRTKEYTDEEIRNYAGGNTKLHAIGYYKYITKFDYTSLYPSIMIAWNIKPEMDESNVFITTLKGLYTKRVNYKKEAKALMSRKQKGEKLTEQEEEDISNFTNYSSALKIMINSAYGLLGYRMHSNQRLPASRFSDIKASSEVTAIGRNLITSIEDILLKRGLTMIETDTDGIMLTRDSGFKDMEDLRNFSNKMIDEFNRGFSDMGKPNLALDLEKLATGIISIKMKNYVLFDEEENGKYDITPHGSTILDFRKPMIVKKTVESFINEVIKAPSMEDLFKKFSFLYIASPLEDSKDDFIAYCSKFKKEDFLYNMIAKEASSYKSDKPDIMQKVLAEKYHDYYGKNPMSDTEIKYYITSFGNQVKEKADLAENFNRSKIDYADYLKQIKKTIITLVLDVYDVSLKSDVNVKYDEKENKIEFKKAKGTNPYSDDAIFDKDWYKNIFSELTDRTKNKILTTVYNHQVVGDKNFFRPMLTKFLYPFPETYKKYLDKKMSELSSGRKNQLKEWYYFKKYKELPDSSQEKLQIKAELNDDELLLFDTGEIENYIKNN